jgi:hypothetical protein
MRPIKKFQSGVAMTFDNAYIGDSMVNFIWVWAMVS